MVTSVTSFGRSGLYDWLIQRVTSVVVAGYTLVILGLLMTAPEMTYEYWSGLFDQLWLKLMTLVALGAALIHAWIGLWSVTTDYLTSRIMGAKGTAVRVIVQMILGLTAAVFLLWGIAILWGQ